MAFFFNKKNSFFIFLVLGLSLSIYYSILLGNPLISYPVFYDLSAYEINYLSEFGISQSKDGNQKSIYKFSFHPNSFVLFTDDGSDPVKNGKKLEGNLIHESDLSFIIPSLGSYINSLHWRPGFIDQNIRLLRAVCVDPISKQISTEHQILFANHSSSETGISKISISFDKSQFINFFNGIGVIGFSQNYNPSKNWWEQKGNFTKRENNYSIRANFSIQNSKCNFNSSFGELKISGNASRSFPKKSYSFIFHSKSPNNSLRVNNNTELSSEIILRGGSNDWNKAIIRDAFAERIASSVFLNDSRGMMPSLLYFNGEYFGLYFIYPRVNEKTLANKYMVNEEDVLFWEDEISTNKPTEANLEIDNLFKFLKNENYSIQEKVQRIGREIDIANFYRYVIFQQFFSNLDWPYGNNKMYKIRNQGKWKFISNDLDISMGINGTEIDGTLDAFKFIQGDKSLIPALFSTLMKDKKMKQEFLIIYHDLLKNQLSETNLLSQLDIFLNEIEPYVHDHIKRWRSHNNLNSWSEQIEIIRKFIHIRSMYLNALIANERSLTK